jgi:hypothetical protein
MTRKSHNQRSFAPIGTGKVFTLQDLCNAYSRGERWRRDLLKRGLRIFPAGNDQFTTEDLLAGLIESGAVTWDDIEDGRKGPSESE